MAKQRIKTGRQFISWNQNDDDDIIAQGIISREREIAAYDLNITLFEQQLQGDITPEFASQLEARLVSERRELAKSEATYAALLALLPSGSRRDEAIARVIAKNANI